jgi:mono/diheme cytochrome c family protein
MLLANTARSIGYVIAALTIVGFVVFAFATYRKAKPEVGSEIELAPNRGRPLDDDVLESSRLDRTLYMGLGTLIVIALALPLYWLAEPGRQDGWVQTWDDTFVSRGEESFTGACASCHGAEGVGGVASYVLTDSDGAYVDTVEWQAPALNTVLSRYSKEEVLFTLTYGRPNSPMPAWGLEGGGALNEQQLDELVAYLESIQLPADQMRGDVTKELTDRYVNGMIAAEEADAGEELEGEDLLARKEALTADVEGHLAEGVYDYDFDGATSVAELGEAMFNLGLDTGFAGGAYSCARCHTKGASWGQPEVSGGGFLGPNLTGGSTLRQFPTFEDHVGFITEGAERGQPYGSGGMSGAGIMPGFGYNPNAEEEGSTLTPEQFMYTQEQIDAVVAYERGL